VEEAEEEEEVPPPPSGISHRWLHSSPTRRGPPTKDGGPETDMRRLGDSSGC